MGFVTDGHKSNNNNRNLQKKSQHSGLFNHKASSSSFSTDFIELDEKKLSQVEQKRLFKRMKLLIAVSFGIIILFLLLYFFLKLPTSLYYKETIYNEVNKNDFKKEQVENIYNVNMYYGRSYLLANKYEKALELFHIALKHKPNDEDAINLLNQSYQLACEVENKKCKEWNEFKNNRLSY